MVSFEFVKHNIALTALLNNIYVLNMVISKSDICILDSSFLYYYFVRDQQNRNSRILGAPPGGGPPKKPTDQLDELAKQLQDLVPSPGRSN